MGDEQRAKAVRLLDLHRNGRLLVLPNVWNPIGARVLEARGYPAVATASAAISASLGYLDGERLQRGSMIEMIGRIATSVDVPVTADIEGGYADSLDELAETIELLLDSGAVGINLEDSLEEGGELRAVNRQCDRIAHVRQVADRRGIPLVINARTDSFVSGPFAHHAERIDDCVARARDYAAAGADCIYPMGPGDLDTLRQLREHIETPLNVLVTAAAVSLEQLQEIGVNRASLGPFVFRSCLAKFERLVTDLARMDSAPVFAEMLAREDVAEILRAEPEVTPVPGLGPVLGDAEGQ